MPSSPSPDSPRGAAFPSTRWSRLAADPADPAAGRAALEELARRYRRPIEAYVRARFGGGEERARELTQDFLVHALERDLVARADPARGRFRAFVKTSLANFLRDRARREAAERRGGGRARVPLEEAVDAEQPAAGQRGAEELLDDLWRRELLAAATDALEAELRAGGMELHWELFRAFHLEEPPPDYASLAAQHGISKVDVSNRLQRARRRFRAHVRAAVAETVRDDDELRAELAWLLEEEPG